MQTFSPMKAGPAALFASYPTWTGIVLLALGAALLLVIGYHLLLAIKERSWSNMILRLIEGGIVIAALISIYWGMLPDRF